MDPPAGTEALLFDCDGTLVDTLSLYRICWRQVFGRHGFEMSDAWFEQNAGTHVYDFVEAAFPSADPGLRIGDHRRGDGDVHGVRPSGGAAGACGSRRPGHHGRLPLAVVSSGPDAAVRESLAAVGITELFDVVLTLADVAEGKPAPDGYLQAMALLGADPSRCVAYEDSTTGIAAARAAGIPTVVDVRRHLG